MLGRRPGCYVAILFAVSSAFSGIAAETSDSDWKIQLLWGIWPDAETFGRWNGTVLLDAKGDTPILADMFTNSTAEAWSIGLLEVEEGAWQDGRGWLTPAWLDTSPCIMDVALKEPGTSVRIPKVWIQESGAPDTKFSLSINRFGDWHDLTAEQRNLTNQVEYYTDVWARHKAVIVMRDKAARRTHSLSETPGLEDTMVTENDIAAGSVASLFSMAFFGGISAPDPHNPPPQLANNLPLVISTPSKKVYIGPQIPPYCIWMADYELTQEYLATLPQGQVEAAFGLRKHPMDPYCVWMNEFGLTLADLETLRPELVALAYERGVSPSNPFCVWMVDWGLTQEDLDSLEEDYVDFAFENRMDPRDDRCRWMYDFELTPAYLATLPEAQVREAFERRVHPEDASFLRAFHATVFMMR